VTPSSWPSRPWTRRGLLTAGATGLAALGAPACAGPSEHPELGVSGMLDRIDPSATEGDGRLMVSWSRPAAAAAALDLQAGEDWTSGSGRMARLHAVGIGHSQLILQNSITWGVDDTAFFNLDDVLATAEEVCVSRGPQEAVLWTDAAALLDDYEVAMGWRYTRDGDALRLAEDQRGTEPPSVQLIAQLGEDLVITTSDSTDVFDTGESTASGFRDLPTLLAALDLDDAHLACGCALPDPGPDQALEWIWATRFDGTDDHTTRGAVRVQGDAAEYARRLVDGAADADTRIVVQEAEADGDLIAVTLSHDRPVDAHGWDDVRHFYASMMLSDPAAADPGVPIAEGQ
jgi:hypothetical protein